MFREIMLPIFRSTRLCVTACGYNAPTMLPATILNNENYKTHWILKIFTGVKWLWTLHTVLVTLHTALVCSATVILYIIAIIFIFYGIRVTGLLI